MRISQKSATIEALMAQFLCQLGQTTDLCWEELRAVSQRFFLGEPRRVHEFFGIVDAPDNFDVSTFQLEMGGTIKIAEIVHTDTQTDPATVTQQAVDLLIGQPVKRFAISEIGRDHMPEVDVYEVKAKLQAAGQRVAYHESPRSGVNAASLKNRRVTEVLILQTETGVTYGITRACQDVDTWTQRDMDKPVRDRKRGMLPPKVARMMVNIGIGSDQPEEHVVLDPFVGVGTALLEAADLDVKTVLGNDVDPQAIIATTQNIKWWRQISGQEFEDELVVRPAEKLDRIDFKTPPTVIVTEPFLGKLTPKDDQIPGIIRGLEKLYKGSLKAFTRLLSQDGGRVVIILPEMTLQSGRKLTTTQTLKDAHEMGFTQVLGPMRAGRSTAHTQRQVYVLEYQPYGTR